MDDEYVVMAEEAMIGGSLAAIPGAFWIDFLPFLRHIPSWVPGAKFKQHAEKYLPYVVNMRYKPYQDVKAAVVSSLFYKYV